MSLRALRQGETGSDTKHVRLSVNLAVEVATVLQGLIERRAISITEGVRRAILVWQFVEDEQAKGNKIAVISNDEGGKTSVREVVLLS